MRTLFSVVALTMVLSGCGLIGAPGGRVRAAGAYTAGDGHAPSSVVSIRAGVTPVAWFDEERDWDVEAGYVLEAFPGQRPLDVQGGYLGFSYIPTIGRMLGESVRLRLVTGLDADLMAGIDRVVAGGTVTLGIELFDFDAEERSGGGGTSGGFLHAFAGEWSIGVVAFGSYRYAVDVGHYAVVGGGISLRFPSAVAAAYVLPFGVDSIVRGETPEEREERDAERGERRRERRVTRRHRRRDRRARRAEERRTAPAVVCFDANWNRIEASTMEEAREACPDCECTDNRPER